MSNLVLITSILYPPTTPLSYTNVRSVFTPDERFQQTKRTIQSIREKIPDSTILIVECSPLKKEEHDYFKENVDFLLNLYENEDIRSRIHSASKSLGEGTMTLCALEFLKQQSISFNHFFKITGRYWLSQRFQYDRFDNDNIVASPIDGDKNNVCTSLYKLNYKNLTYFYEFLTSNLDAMYRCIGYEIIFARFLNTLIEKFNIDYVETIGINGLISVSNDFIDL